MSTLLSFSFANPRRTRERFSHVKKSSDLNAGHYITNPHNALFYTTPRCSMYGIFADISPKFMVNVCIYSIHGAYGLHLHCLIPPKTANLISPVEVENSHL